MSRPNFFSAGSPYLNHPLLTPERTVKEIDFVLSQLDIPPRGRVLDVGCGPGRHSLELAQRGYRVVGIDPAAAMIRAAREQAREIEPAPEFQQVRGEDFTLAGDNKPFDAAICLFTSLGQMDESGDNSPLVARVARALHPGGKFVVEVPQRDWVAKNLKGYDHFGNNERYTDVTRRFNPGKNTVTETFTLVSPGEKRVYLLRYRLYNQAELVALLEQAGLEVITAYGGYDAIPLHADSPIMIMFARKPF